MRLSLPCRSAPRRKRRSSPATSPPWTARPKLTIRFDKAGEKRVVDSFVGKGLVRNIYKAAKWDFD